MDKRAEAAIAEIKSRNLFRCSVPSLGLTMQGAEAIEIIRRHFAESDDNPHGKWSCGLYVDRRQSISRCVLELGHDGPCRLEDGI